MAHRPVVWVQEDFSFSMLIKQRAEDDTVILIGFNYGYQVRASYQPCSPVRFCVLEADGYVWLLLPWWCRCRTCFST